jgi:ribosomal protein L37AE/L43A
MMEEKILTKGVCNTCKELLSIRAAKNHIIKCLQQDTKDAPDAFLVKVQWPQRNPLYWLYLSVPYKSKLAALDLFLRKTWLECCGHLSQFIIDRKRYSSDCEDNVFGGYEEFPLSIRSEQVLMPGLKFMHEYDFGSTTELLLEVVGVIKATVNKKIGVIMQNQEPQFNCTSCGEKAIMIDSLNGDYFCPSCVEEEEDDDERYLLPLVNSPRTGVCGYVG